jgi:CubicO group peptidase (beta-lactamase class C family)
LGNLNHIVPARRGGLAIDVQSSFLMRRDQLMPIRDVLGMQDTSITLSADQQRRFAQGHGADRRPAHAWDIASLVGAGGIRSTAADMLTYLEANLRQSASKATATSDGRTLAAALKRSQTPQADVGGSLKIAFAWMYDTATETYWHNGGTGGYSSFAFFNPRRNYAGVVLVNMTLSPRGSFADTVGNHIGARFAGEKALSLSDW